MTPEPQKEYIITEEELKTFFDCTYPMLEYWKAEGLINTVRSRPVPTTSAEQVPVYEYKVHLPLKNIPSITRRKLALNDIGKDEDGFCRLDFELKDGDVIQVFRQRGERELP